MFNRRLRRLTAKIVIAAVLFTQMTVAAYACSGMNQSVHTAPPAVTADHQHAGMTGDCAHKDTGNLNICQQHCQAGSQSVESAPQLSAPPAAILPVTVLVPFQPLLAVRISVLSALLERETAPPPLIRFRVFRI